MQKDVQSTIAYSILMIGSTLFMLLFAYNTSPLFEYLGVDSSMYLVMGKAMAQGKILYSDLFDHKGPILFMFNMLPQLLMDGTIGVWLTELFLIILSTIILYKMASQSINSILSLCIPLVYLWVTVTLFNGGNYTEEYSNFFCLISLFVFDKWLKDKKLTSSMSYGLGLCFGLVFFIRPNNVALIVTIILFIGMDLLRKSPDKIKSAFIFGSLGMMSVTLPLILYHLSVGTLYEMFDATFLHNIKYCQVGAERFRLIPNGNSQQLLCFFIALGIHLIAMCTCYSSDEIKIGNFILLSSIVIAFALLIGRHPYMYYWTLLAPLTAYSALFIIKYGIRSKKKSLSTAILALIFVLVCINSFLGTKIIEKKSYITEYKRSTHAMYNLIPDDEKNDCFAYNMPAMFIYEVSLNTPCKYFTMQTWMAKINPDIAKYCTDYVRKNKPSWVLSYFDFQTDTTNPELSEILRTGYTEVFNNDCGYLYRKVKSVP
ncbi:hypothetical protein CS063_11945 [Sporanaerobium hydrogeniformans]|uniref:Uncharacterized protein n=1 Tax=Sporanaerobium hydrogeniformans TaxID=3072179 RepID=A0AC61DBK0_9FIRM|nr:hypothetical protein [Sporanaerobium hydrogeniformans]PHV70183.1 hypothetical protein CS063_11945 [Sporanaerobium hydrogeniformans]